MNIPYQTSMPSRLKWLLLATALAFTVTLLLNQPLKTPHAPQGMVSFQLAGSAKQSVTILRSWGGDGKSWAVTSLVADFVFIALYLSMLLLLTSYLLSNRPGVREQKLGHWVQTLFIAAGISDVGENILLLNNLLSPTDTISLAATACALMKFTGLVVGAAGLVVIRTGRHSPRQR